MGVGVEAAVAAVAFRVTVADGEIDGADATLGVFSAAMLGETVAELGIAEALGDTWAVGPAARGAIRCTLRISFITEKPTTSTKIPNMSGIGDIRSCLEGRTTGVLTCFCA